MNEISKLGPGMYLIVVIALIIAGGLTLSSNPYKSAYQNEVPVSYAMADDKEGYPAGDDIPVAKSIEDIKNNEYCTIEVSKENIESTRVFEIKDRSEVVKEKTSKVGRRYVTSEVKEGYYLDFSWLGDIYYALRQVGWNLDNTSYGEWCVVTLESGERIYVFVDLKILSIKDEKIKLPIGTIMDNYNLGKLTSECEKFGIEEENADWYVDMVGDWEENEVGDIDVFGLFCVGFIIAIPLLLIGFYFFIVKRDKAVKTA